MNAYMTAVTIQSNKIVLNEVNLSITTVIIWKKKNIKDFRGNPIRGFSYRVEFSLLIT